MSHSHVKSAVSLMPESQSVVEHQITILEQAIEAEPENIALYLKLGVAQLVLEQEDAAQTTWLYGMSLLETEAEVNKWTDELICQLATESDTQAAQSQWRVSWLLRQHLRELAPNQIHNLLCLIRLEISLNQFTPKLISEWQIIDALKTEDTTNIDSTLLCEVLGLLLEYVDPDILALVDTCLMIPSKKEEIQALLYQTAYDFIVRRSVAFDFAIELLERVVSLNPKHRIAWHLLAFCYDRLNRFPEAIHAGQTNFDLCETFSDRYAAISVLSCTYLKAGLWQQAEPALAQNHQLLHTLLTETPADLNVSALTTLLTDPAHFLYLKDDIAANRQIQNQATAIFHEKYLLAGAVQPMRQERRQRPADAPLKIGFIGRSLYDHSIGWLSRWLFKHLDPSAFSTSLYLITTQPSDPFIQRWIAPYVSQVHRCSDDASQAAEKIAVDQIDILIDLEGQTLPPACSILSLKPTPIQATWLGWDASGLPSVDYFIADPYVLPENAQQHYQEKIWRLPQTYLSVEGFEIATPNLRRDDLQIPSNAVVYLSCQASYKRNPNNIRRQMQIIQQVPGSYLLIKGQSHTKILEDLFFEIAESEGVAPDRLRFLPQAPSEMVHRANLQIADVVLDTFPYNGATTTLETLWMGIPVVTLAGSQFTARYGYTLLTNAGLTEGIAWSEQEYVEWGVRYGTDAKLRLEVAHKLRQGRHSAPLWDAKKFTREMENAFRRMWQIYAESAAF